MEQGNVYQIISSDGMIIHTSTNDSYTAFVGVVDNKTIQTSPNIEQVCDLLIRGINNRTRERNYFRKYCELLNGEITDDEFDTEMEANEDEYVIKENIDANAIDARIALSLAPKIMDAEYVEDVSTLFSFNPNSLRKLIGSN